MEFNRNKLMIASFLTLVASGVGFATRAAAGYDWGQAFNIGGLQFGAIMGAGFLGFGVMIFFGGILVEKFGYKLLLLLAFLLHMASAVMLLVAPSMFDGWLEGDAATATENVFSLLFWSAFLFSIAQGLYEAVINPLIGDLYPENKTHYLNILHAGWPAGMIIGGLFAACFMGKEPWITHLPWQYAMSSFAIFVVAYAVMAFTEKFPATAASRNENFLKTFACFLSAPFLLLIVLHALIGYMELGVDSWISKLMENLLPNAIIILVYTSALMFILRFFAGPIVHKINPIGLLFASSIVACGGLLWLSQDITSVAVIFVAVTFYSFGKAFLWPTMLAVAGERYPASGAIAMGALGAAGMLTVGLVAGPTIGAQQGYYTSEDLKETAPDTYDRYTDEDKEYWSYSYKEVSGDKYSAASATPVDEDGTVSDTSAFANADLLDAETKTLLTENASTDVPAVKASYLIGSRKTLQVTSYIPAAMAVGFLLLLIYYRSIGGYKVLNPDGSVKEDGHGSDKVGMPPAK
ncbi:MAG: MFS transporter [Planctomycetota bacterium]